MLRRNYAIISWPTKYGWWPSPMPSRLCCNNQSSQVEYLSDCYNCHNMNWEWEHLGRWKAGYSKSIGTVPGRRRIPARWWSSKGSSHGRRGQKAMGNEIWWVFYHPIRGSGSSFVPWRRQGSSAVVQAGIPLFKQHSIIRSLPNRVGHNSRNERQAFKGIGWFELSGLPN